MQSTLRVSLLRQITHPSIHATEVGFLQSGRYKLKYEESNFDSRQWKNILTSSKVPRPILGASQPPIQGILGTLSSGKAYIWMPVLKN